MRIRKDIGKYRWRKMNDEQRREALAYRVRKKYPWHGPQHRAGERTSLYHLTAACYQHDSIIGKTPQRMDAFSGALIEELITKHCEYVWCWCVLPNHYHVLLKCDDIHALIHDVGRLHGRLSRQWNQEDGLTGKRQCWHRCVDRYMRSEAHQWATVNYIHHNPVHHGYVKKWQDWPWSSAADYLNKMGTEKALAIWNDYPVLDYGKGWDDALL